MLLKSLPAKTVVQNVRTELLAEKTVGKKLTSKMTVLKCGLKSVSANTVVQNVRSERLGEKASAKTTIKKNCTDMLPKTLPAKTVVSKCPNVLNEILAEKPSEKH